MGKIRGNVDINIMFSSILAERWITEIIVEAVFVLTEFFFFVCWSLFFRNEDQQSEDSVTGSIVGQR